MLTVWFHFENSLLTERKFFPSVGRKNRKSTMKAHTLLSKDREDSSNQSQAEIITGSASSSTLTKFPLLASLLAGIAAIFISFSHLISLAFLLTPLISFYLSLSLSLSLLSSSSLFFFFLFLFLSFSISFL